VDPNGPVRGRPRDRRRRLGRPLPEWRWKPPPTGV